MLFRSVNSLSVTATDGKNRGGGRRQEEGGRRRGAGLLARGRDTGPPGREEAHPERHIREKRTLGFPF